MFPGKPCLACAWGYREITTVITCALWGFVMTSCECSPCLLILCTWGPMRLRTRPRCPRSAPSMVRARSPVGQRPLPGPDAGSELPTATPLDHRPELSQAVEARLNTERLLAARKRKPSAMRAGWGTRQLLESDRRRKRRGSLPTMTTSLVLECLWLEKNPRKETDQAKLSSLFPRAHIESQENHPYDCVHHALG